MRAVLRFPPLTCRVFSASGLSLDFPQVCPGHMKDEFITTTTNRIEAKTNREKSSGGGVGPSSLDADSHCKQHGGGAAGVDWFAST